MVSSVDGYKNETTVKCNCEVCGMSKNLTLEQRRELSELKRLKKPVKYIAKALGVHRSSIYRELKRNSGRNGYRPVRAHKLASEKNKRCGRCGYIEEATIDRVKECLKQGMSPVEISVFLKNENMNISHDTIYRYIEKDREGGGNMHIHLKRSKYPKSTNEI